MSPSGRARILVVDDERGIRDLLGSELGACGYDVETAADGAEAVERVRRGRYQLVISDVKMPRLGGLQMLEAVRRLDPDVEVIMSTGCATVEMAVEAMKKGAYDFVQKPFNLDEILALVEKALEKGELRALLGLYESSKAVFSSVKLETLLPVMARLAAGILRADDAALVLPGPAGRPAVAAQWRLPGGQAAARLAAAAHGAAARGPVVLAGTLAFPLAVEGEPVGVLCVHRVDAGDDFSEADLRHACILGAQVAQAVRNAQLHAAVVQSEKLAAVGQLAAGVAHEINNPLTAIMGLAQLMLDGSGLGAGQREDLEGVVRETQRCREIVQNLLQFSRRRPPAREPVEVQGILEATLRLVRHDFRAAGLGLELAEAPGLPLVRADAGQLQQVFLNLVTNARQAMEGRPGAALRVSAEGAGGRVLVRFADEGVGIAPEDLPRVFEPFFSTKPIGQGTGLGLSISHGIVAGHGGALTVESRPGEGSTFTVDLPAAGDGA